MLSRWRPLVKDHDLYNRTTKNHINKFVAKCFSINGGKCLYLESELGKTTKALSNELVDYENMIAVNDQVNVINKLSKKFPITTICGDVFDIIAGMKDTPNNIWLDLTNNITANQLSVIQDVLVNSGKDQKICLFMTITARKYKNPKGEGFYTRMQLCNYISESIIEPNSKFVNTIRWIYGRENNYGTNLVLMQYWNHPVVDRRINLPIYRMINNKSHPHGINNNDIVDINKISLKRSLDEVKSHIMWKRIRRFK